MGDTHLRLQHLKLVWAVESAAHELIVLILTMLDRVEMSRVGLMCAVSRSWIVSVRSAQCRVSWAVWQLSGCNAFSVKWLGLGGLAAALRLILRKCSEVLIPARFMVLIHKQLDFCSKESLNLFSVPRWTLYHLLPVSLSLSPCKNKFSSPSVSLLPSNH